MFKLDSIDEMIPKIVELADVARKGGLLALEGQEVENDFLKEGIKMLVDGHDAEVVSGGTEQRFGSSERPPYLGR